MPRFSTLIRCSTLRVAGAVAALAVTAPLTMPSHAADEKGVIRLSCAKAKLVTGSGEWQSFPAPTFSVGVGVTAGQNIVSYAVSPVNTQVLAVTNGNSVYVSRDGGCAWVLGFRLDQLPSSLDLFASGALTTIKSVYITAGAMFALAETLESGATVGRPLVIRSTTGAVNTWRASTDDQGLPPIGKPLLLRGHRTNKSVVYLTFAGAREETNTCPPPPVPCDAGGRRLGLMYASTDGGTTWSARTEPGDLNSVAEIKHFSVDDDDPGGSLVWAVANGQLYKSTNGGRSYVLPDGVDQSEFEFTAVESLANTAASDGLKVIAFSNRSEMLRLSKGAWIRSTVPFGSVESVAQRPEGDLAVATAPDGRAAEIWRIYPRDFYDYVSFIGLGGKVFRSTFGWERITPQLVLRKPARVTAGDSPQGDGTYYARTDRTVLRFLRSAARNPNPGASAIRVGAPPPPRGKITPSPLTIDIPVGKTKTVDYVLTLPPAPTPIDVYLLVDNSGSMSPTIDALKRDLGAVARSLNASGVDVNMGVGQINVQPERQSLPVDDPRTKEVDESKPRPIYQKLRGIGPVDPNLFSELGKLDGNGGSGQEPQLEALWQAVRGDGLSFNNLGWLIGYSIPPGNNAGFRDALSPIKVIVHATDEEFSRDITGGHNNLAEVAKALVDADVKQIGLSQGVEEAAADLREMAKRTGALAPPGGTDCDGDGRIGPEDVKAGRPLVCGTSFGLDKTLVNLIRSLSDPQVITLTNNKAATLKDISDTSFGIDAKKSTRRTFSVTFSCKGLAAGQYVNNVTAALRGKVIAEAVAAVNCGGLAVPAPAIAGEPVYNPPPPQPQPIVPAPAPVQPVPQPQTQVQMNPQAGAAEQEEEQFSLAVANNDITENEELAMSRLAYEDHPAVVLTLGMALAAGAGVALRRRTRTSPAKARISR